MRLAIAQAEAAWTRLEVPVGCVIVHNNRVAAAGSNRTNETRNATRHAELEAVDSLLESLSAGQVNECFGQIDPPRAASANGIANDGANGTVTRGSHKLAGERGRESLSRVFYGCPNDRFGAVAPCCRYTPTDATPARPCTSAVPGCQLQCVGGILASEAVDLLRRFYEQGNPNGQMLTGLHRAAQGCTGF
ncbi:hypothetical protein CLOP_g17560 [Closterium sp. NIES-67]|nr:hypothetical protein CLOP_g17560 [Closterium sp. NIES-67]